MSLQDFYHDIFWPTLHGGSQHGNPIWKWESRGSIGSRSCRIRAQINPRTTRKSESPSFLPRIGLKLIKLGTPWDSDAPKLCHSPRRHWSALVWAPAVPVAPWAPCHWTRTTWPAFWATCGTLESVFLLCFNGFLRYHYSMVDLFFGNYIMIFYICFNSFLRYYNVG